MQTKTKPLDVGAFLQGLVDNQCCFSGAIILIDELECKGRIDSAEEEEEVEEEAGEKEAGAYDMFREASFPGGTPVGGGISQDAILMDNPSQS